MYGASWTADRVIGRLVVAFRRLPSTPVYSPVTWSLEPAAPGVDIDGAYLIVATGLYLGFRSPLRRRLLAYARARGSGQAIRHLCQLEGWPRASLYRHVRVSAEHVAVGLNHCAGGSEIPCR